MSRRQAEAAGYRELAGDYRLPAEQEMLDNVVADMRRAKVDHVVVRDGVGLSVWRRAPGVALAGGHHAECGTGDRRASKNPSPLPLSPSDGARGFFLRAVTRGGGRKRRAALPRATFLNPAGVLKLGRLRRKGKKSVEIQKGDTK